jgi:hypothetical protein
MKAKYAGYCQACGKKYPIGTEIRINPASGKWIHSIHFTPKQNNQLQLFKDLK